MAHWGAGGNWCTLNGRRTWIPSMTALFLLSARSQASIPVQEYLSMPFEQAQIQTEVARHLPPPLYVLFVQANAYGQACGMLSCLMFQHKVKLFLMGCKTWLSWFTFVFHFRQEPVCLNKWWCGWGQGAVQTPRRLAGYKHDSTRLPLHTHTLWSALCKNKKMNICVSLNPDDESDSDAEEEQEKTVSIYFQHITHRHSGQWVQRFLIILVFVTDTEMVSAVTRCSLAGWREATIDLFLLPDGDLDQEWPSDCNLSTPQTCTLCWDVSLVESICSLNKMCCLLSLTDSVEKTTYIPFT